jgi:serine/threonine-protein phosphatase 5
VIGDTHGQFHDFLYLLKRTGRPSDTHAIIFNGDFVDRGSKSVEIALTIFAYKWLYPKMTFINRGNHETLEMNENYGFEEECSRKFKKNKVLTFALFTQIFVALPVATLITAACEPLQGDQLPSTYSRAQRDPILTNDNRKRFFVVHGGLPFEDEVTLDDIRAIDRFRIAQPGGTGVMAHLLWSDPMESQGRSRSLRDTGHRFGPDISKAWCEANKVTAILRSHETKMKGYSEDHDGLCCTIFSAPNYCGTMGNLGAWAHIDDQGTIIFNDFHHQRSD